jgi:hypothetical protein
MVVTSAIEILSAISAILLAVPALRVSFALIRVWRTCSQVKNLAQDDTTTELANLWSSSMQTIISKWRPIDHWCLLVGLLVHLCVSVLKVCISVGIVFSLS